MANKITTFDNIFKFDNLAIGLRIETPKSFSSLGKLIFELENTVNKEVVLHDSTVVACASVFSNKDLLSCLNEYKNNSFIFHKDLKFQYSEEIFDAKDFNCDPIELVILFNQELKNRLTTYYSEKTDVKKKENPLK